MCASICSSPLPHSRQTTMLPPTRLPSRPKTCPPLAPSPWISTTAMPPPNLKHPPPSTLHLDDRQIPKKRENPTAYIPGSFFPLPLPAWVSCPPGSRASAHGSRADQETPAPHPHLTSTPQAPHCRRWPAASRTGQQQKLPPAEQLTAGLLRRAPMSQCAAVLVTPWLARRIPWASGRRSRGR